MHSHAIPLTRARRLLSLRALLMVAVSVFLLSPSAPAVAAVSPAFAFVTDRGSGMIQTFEIFDSPGNPSDRALVPKSSLQMPPGMFPLTIKLSHSGRFAYVLTDGSPSVKPQILTYAVNPTTGELTLQGMVETTLPTGGLAVSPDDEFVYLTSAGASDALPGVTYYAIWWFAIDPQAGTLTVVDTVDVGTQPDDLTFDSTGQFLYVTLKNRNAMGMFGLDATGKPIPLNPPTVDTGLSPLLVALNPVRPFLYAANIANGVLGSVSSYQIEPKGTLTSLGAVDAGSFPGSIKVHPSGQFLYVANETPKGPTGNIMVYTIAATGTLNLLQTVSTGSSPRSMAFDASGTALYATNFHSNTVSMYRIDTVTGELSSLGIGTVEAGAWPNDVATTPPEASPPPGQGPARNDVNGDGNSDILWLNIVTGDVVV